MPCTNCGGDTKTVIRNGEDITFTGTGTPVDPYVPHLRDQTTLIALEVRDSSSINFSLIGSGQPGDPYVLTGDTSSAARLTSLGDVAANPGPGQGRVPLWIGTPSGGHFELRTPGTRYTTHSGRGNGLYQGEVIRETDTGERFEWDGGSWVNLQPATVPASALDPSVVQNKGYIDQNTDYNTLVNGSAIYRVGGGIGPNGPTGAFGYGTLVVYKAGNSVSQIYYSHNGTRRYERSKWNDADWNAWTMGATMADIQNVINDRAGGDSNLQNQINAEAGIRSQQDQNIQNNVNGRAPYDYVNGYSYPRSETYNQAEVQGQASYFANSAASYKATEIYNQYDGGRLDGRYFTQGALLTNGYFARNISGSSRIQRGEGTATGWQKDNTTNTYVGRLNIGYGAFSSAPSVIATALSADSGGVTCTIVDRGTQGAAIVVVRRNPVDTGVTWVAVGD